MEDMYIENISYRRGGEKKKTIYRKKEMDNRATVFLLSDQSHFCVANDLINQIRQPIVREMVQ